MLRASVFVFECFVFETTDTKLRYGCVPTPFGLLEGDMARYSAVKATEVRKLVFRVPDVIHLKYE